jgi:hypothetical protein
MKTLLITWVWLVTSIDIWCCQWLTVDSELNPLAKLIMIHAGVFGMVACKVFGTFVATELLRRLPLFYSYIISALMLLLLLFLAGIIS